MINARAETVSQKPSFRHAFRRRRCIVPATGYFEWQKVNGGKQPWRSVPAGGGLFGFAGLWERWEKGEEPVEAFCIIVTAANELARSIHDRMPVILDPDGYEAWLRSEDTTLPLAMLQSYPVAKMRAYPVSRRIGNPRNDDPELIVEAGSRVQSSLNL